MSPWKQANRVHFFWGTPDLFAWRTDYSPRFNADREEIAGAELARRIDDEFGEYVERTATDYDQHTRAPWTRGPND